MAPPSRSAPHPWRALTGLIVIMLVMLFSILGSATFSPGKWHQQFKVGLGLDLSSGTQVVLKAATPGNKPPTAGSMQQAINVLLSRVNGTGNSGAQVQQEGTNLINVSVPGKAADQVINLISTTAQLRFRAALLYEPYGVSSTTTPSAQPSGTASPSPSGSSSPSPAASGPGPDGVGARPVRGRQQGQRRHDEAVRPAEVHAGSQRQYRQ